MYTDNPQPSKGYLLLLLCIFLGIVCLHGAFMRFFFLQGASRSALLFVACALALSLLGCSALLLAVFHAAYHTQYTLRDHRLELKGGGILKRTVALEQIVEVKRVPYNARLLGWGMSGGGERSMGVCNRFRNGVVLITRWENIYLSPSDPDTFVEVLSSSLHH